MQDITPSSKVIPSETPLATGIFSSPVSVQSSSDSEFEVVSDYVKQTKCSKCGLPFGNPEQLRIHMDHCKTETKVAKSIKVGPIDQYLHRRSRLGQQ